MCVTFHAFLCNISHILCNILHIECNIPRIVCSISHIECTIPRILCNIPHIECNIPHIVCNIFQDNLKKTYLKSVKSVGFFPILIEKSLNCSGFSPFLERNAYQAILTSGRLFLLWWELDLSTY